MSIAIEAEFVEVGKHQKVVTDIWSMPEHEALVEFASWKRCVEFVASKRLVASQSPRYWQRRTKQIRNNLRSFGWYIVKSKGGYSLMEEATIDDVCPDQMSLVRQLWEAIIEKQLNCASTKYFVKARGFHIVWVPSLKKRLIMRSVT